MSTAYKAISQAIWAAPEHGTTDQTWTGTLFQASDFKSEASADSATVA